MGRNIAISIGLSGIAGRVRCEPGWSLDANWSRQLTDFDLWLVWAGRGKMKLSRGEIDLAPGTCVWMRPGGSYVAQQDPADRLGVSFCHFTYKGQVDDEPGFEVTRVRSLELAQSMMAEVIRWKTDRPEVSVRLLADLLEVLTLDHAAGWGIDERRRSQPSHRNHERMQALAAAIAEEPGRDWSVRSMAKSVGYAPDHFSRVFQGVLGQRPQSYVLTTRLSRARQLLGETNLAISEIAHVLGFRDAFYFSRQFRAVCGVPPSSFRRDRRDESDLRE